MSYHVQLTLSSPCRHRLVYRVSNHRLFTLSSPYLHHRVFSRHGGLHDMSYRGLSCPKSPFLQHVFTTIPNHVLSGIPQFHTSLANTLPLYTWCCRTLWFLCYEWRPGFPPCSRCCACHVCFLHVHAHEIGDPCIVFTTAICQPFHTIQLCFLTAMYCTKLWSPTFHAVRPGPRA